MKQFASLSALIVIAGMACAQEPYMGTSMGFTHYLENRCGIIFREEGVPRDPFESLAAHGATMARIHVGHPPFSSSYSEGIAVDHYSVEQAKISMQRARDAGLNTLLTFSYQSFALEDRDNLNLYVAPLAWQPVASDLNRMIDSVYHFTYAVLDDYCEAGLVPAIVSIGNESTWHRLMPNVPENELPPYDPSRSVALHNAGSRAVRDIAARYDTTIKVCFHMRGPEVTKWWLEEHWPYGPDLDMIGISLYHGWNFDNYAGYSSLGDYVKGITSTYGIEFIVMETAQMFRTGGNDSHVDILGTELIPPGYPNPPTPETQKRYLADVTREVLGNGGAGVLVWGGDWVASDCYIFADQFGKGSSWENKAFWDFSYNLHDGVNWMMEFSGKVPVLFKVDMSGTDTSRGVFVTGDFKNFRDESWVFNRMSHEGNQVFSYTAYMEPGDSGSFSFMNDTLAGSEETIPEACTGPDGIHRMYSIPPDSKGEILAFRWSSCDPVPQLQWSASVNGEGYVSHPSGTFSLGVQIPLLATPGLGWEFTGWTGDTVSTDNPLMITLVSDMEVTAHFRKIPTVPLTFRVDMTGVDVGNGVYVTGDFPDAQGKTWQLNRMWWDEGNIYRFRTEIALGSSGAYYFMNDDAWGVRETVPPACAEYWGSDRGFHIPMNSQGEVYGFVWSSCEPIRGVSAEGWSGPPSASSLEVFPNPVDRGPLRIRFEPHAEVTVTVTDLQGRRICHSVMLSGGDGQLEIPVGILPEGVYLLALSGRHFPTHVAKFMVIHYQ